MAYRMQLVWSELPNMREKTPVMNVHKPPSINVLVTIVDWLTSFSSSFILSPDLLA